ncbi:MAG: twin-arginine translocation signal domain-containing protein, partial [Parabacteroides sp.]|nr:twin-arginine translocation signal domain-containing protein [Parabacteroides sp.]
MNRRKFIGAASVATAVTATGVSVTACNSNT